MQKSADEIAQAYSSEPWWWLIFADFILIACLQQHAARQIYGLQQYGATAFEAACTGTLF
jgi:hypothetical protein